MIVPWCASVATNVIGLIKALVEFPVGSILRKLFCNNRNVRYSYGVAKNMGHHIQGHNNRVLGHTGGEVVTAGLCSERTCRESQRPGGKCWERSKHCMPRTSAMEQR